MNDSDEIRELILDKLRGYITTQKGCHIVTVPSTSYPKGKFYNGQVIEFTQDLKRVIFIDRIEGNKEIPLVTISSPDDIEDYREADYGESSI